MAEVGHSWISARRVAVPLLAAALCAAGAGPATIAAATPAAVPNGVAAGAAAVPNGVAAGAAAAGPSGIPAGAVPGSAATVAAGKVRPVPGQRAGSLRWRDYLRQRVRWDASTCSEEVQHLSSFVGDGSLVVECARVLTQMDWQDTRKGSITLQVTRTRRTHKRGDTRPTRLLFVNPGGPGVVADWFSPASAYLEPDLNEQHDIVAIDPRGTGLSTPLACRFYDDGLSDHRKPSARGIAAQQAVLRKAVQGCVAKAPVYLRQITTANTVRDHDLVRAILGHSKVDWLGLSAGTWMGARFAQRFPNRVGRFVLDSNTQFTADWRTSFSWQPKGFERRLNEQFFPWVARHDSTFHLGRTGREVRASYEAIRATAARGRIRDTTADTVDRYLVAGMYSDRDFPDAAQALAWLRDEVKTGQRLHRLDPPPIGVEATPRGPTWTSAEDTVMMAIQCNDSRWTRQNSSYVEQGLRLGSYYPLLGYTWVVSPCAYWPYPPAPFERVDGAGVPTMLMVQTELDPATPWEGASLASRAHRSVRLLTVDNQGNHGAYLGENACVETRVTRFLSAGQLPAKGTVCDGIPLPWETRVYEVGTRVHRGRPPTQVRWSPRVGTTATWVRAEAARRLASAAARLGGS